MAKKIMEMKAEIIGEVLSFTELENYMREHNFVLIESEEETGQSDLIKFTNYKSQIWIEGDQDEESNILITNLKSITKVRNTPTRVEPFRSYEDLEKVLNYFKKNEMYHHWLTGWLMTSLGRRVGDTVSLKWCDIFLPNGEYRERLTTLKEEKTGKMLGVRLNSLARQYITEYCSLMNVDPMNCYTLRIFSTTDAAFRKALKLAVNEVGIKYRISTHSFRKFYANTIYKLHPQDTDNLVIVQSILGHSDPETTKIYINEIDRKIDQYNEDYAEYMLHKYEGLEVDLFQSPVMSLKCEDFREILSQSWEMASHGGDKFDGINKLLGIAERCMLH